MPCISSRLQYEFSKYIVHVLRCVIVVSPQAEFFARISTDTLDVRSKLLLYTYVSYVTRRKNQRKVLDRCTYAAYYTIPIY